LINCYRFYLDIMSIFNTLSYPVCYLCS